MRNFWIRLKAYLSTPLECIPPSLLSWTAWCLKLTKDFGKFSSSAMFFIASLPPSLLFLYLLVDAPISTSYINLKFDARRFSLSLAFASWSWNRIFCIFRYFEWALEFYCPETMEVFLFSHFMMTCRHSLALFRSDFDAWSMILSATSIHSSHYFHGKYLTLHGYCPV